MPGAAGEYKPIGPGSGSGIDIIVRTILTANTNYYVAIGGSDSNNGLSPATAWATLTHAAIFLAEFIDFAGFTVTVNIGTGTFQGCGIRTTTGGGNLQWFGNGSANTTITQGPNDGVYNFKECFSIAVPNGTAQYFNGFTLKPTDDFFSAIACYVPGVFIYINNAAINSVDIVVDFTGTTAGAASFLSCGAASQIQVSGSFVTATTINVIGGGGNIFMIMGASLGGQITLFGKLTVAISGSLTIASYGGTVITNNGGQIQVRTTDGATAWTGAGVTGPRFLCDSLGEVSTNAAAGTLGPNWFPGNVAGIVLPDGFYDGYPFVQPVAGDPTAVSNIKDPGAWEMVENTALTLYAPWVNNGGTVQQISRYKLTGAATFYVSASGSDTNPGTSGSPWLTLTHAMAYIAGNIDGNGFPVTVNIGAGTFQGVSARPTVGVDYVFFVGAGPASTTITRGPNDGTFNFGECFGNGIPGVTLWVDQVTFAVSGGNQSFIYTFATAAYIGLGNQNTFTGLNIAFNLANFGTVNPVINSASAGGQIGTCSGAVAVSGATGNISVMIAIEALCVFYNFAAWTISGTPNFTKAFAYVEIGNFFEQGGAANYSGAATGPRFLVIGNGAIASSVSGSLGPSWYPGNTAGTVDATSAYDGFPGPLPGIDTQTGASYTLAIGDAYGIVEMNNAGANTLTVPTNASVAFTIGTKIKIVQTGAGATTIAAAGGVTVNNAGAVGGQWKSALLYKTATNTWTQTT